MLNMANVSKNMLDLRSISVTNTLLQDSYKFCKVFFFFVCMALHDVIKDGIPCMGTSPRRAHAHCNQSETTSINVLNSGYGSHRQRCTGLAWEGFVILFCDHEINNVTKEVWFWLWGKVIIRSIFRGHILARISIMPKISRFWLCFPVFILVEDNDLKVVQSITCRHCRPIVASEVGSTENGHSDANTCTC